MEQGEDPLLATKRRDSVSSVTRHRPMARCGALIEGKNWESVKDIAQVYSKWSSFHLTQGHSSGYEAVPAPINDDGCDH